MIPDIRMELKDLIAILGILLANGAALATAFTKLNIKIAGLSRDYISLKADVEEYKVSSKSDLKEFKEIVLRDKIDNKEDHQRIVSELGVVNKSISDMRVDIIKAIQEKNKK